MKYRHHNQECDHTDDTHRDVDDSLLVIREADVVILGVVIQLQHDDI